MPTMLAWSFRARIRGLQAGFTALEALARHRRPGGRNASNVYGIDNRPAELAFRESHHQSCTFCFQDLENIAVKAGNCTELAMMETLQ